MPPLQVRHPREVAPSTLRGILAVSYGAPRKCPDIPNLQATSFDCSHVVLLEPIKQLLRKNTRPPSCLYLLIKRLGDMPPKLRSLPTYLPICLPIPICLPTYLPICLSAPYLPIYLPTYLPVCLPIYLSIYLSPYLPIYLPTYPIYLPIYLPTYLST